MKYNEIRIGNYVIDTIGQQCKLSYDMMQSICSRKGDNGLQPVLLTSEIVEKAGFKQVGDYYLLPSTIIIRFNTFWWWTNAWVCHGENYYEYLTDQKPIAYLHQLQNLYFALTGEELPIEL